MGRSPITRFLAVLSLILIPVGAFAGNVAKPGGGGSSISFDVTTSGHASITLSVSAPDGEVSTFTFANGKAVHLNLKDLASAPDGAYVYQLTANPVVPPGVAKQLEAARQSGDEAGARAIMRKAGLGNPETQTGGFLVQGGMIVSPTVTESSAQDSAKASGITTNAARDGGPDGSRVIGAPGRPGAPVVNDQVIPDDLIVQGSACVGLDCVNNESFGFDTIRMKENNTRIKYEDTSSTSGFPSDDWQLTANDSASGGSNKFSIENTTQGTVPFTVTGGSNQNTNAIFVDSTGRIGNHTSTPVLDFHMQTGNTPAVRFEQTSSGGFTAQTWDIGANEANFFVRDVTGGSLLSLRIRPGAPTSSLDISADGDIGIGTASPAELVHAFANENANTIMQIENPNSGDTAVAVVRADSDSATVNFQAHGSGRNIVRFGQDLGGWNEMLAVTGSGLAIGTNTAVPVILGTNQVNRLHIDTDGDVGINCNAPGSDLVIASGSGCTTPSSSINAGSTAFTAASSRTFKENLEPVTVDNVLDKISQVGVYKYDFIDGPKDRMGLMAEDFHTIFGRGNEKYIDGQDMTMALWLAVQKLTAENKELMDRLAKIEGKVEQK